MTEKELDDKLQKIPTLAYLIKAYQFDDSLLKDIEPANTPFLQKIKVSDKE